MTKGKQQDKPPRREKDSKVFQRRGTTMSQTQIWLPPELRAAVALVQAKENASMGEVTRSAIIWFLRKNYPWALQQARVPEGGSSKLEAASASV